MKHLPVILLLFVATVACAAEGEPDLIDFSLTNLHAYTEMAGNKEKPAYKQTRYWKKHKIYKTCAFTSLGVGLAAIPVGFIGMLACAHTNSDDTGFLISFAGGTVLTVTSIPLFIVSHHYKKKAKRSVELSLSSSTVQETSFRCAAHSRPALTLSVRF